MSTNAVRKKIIEYINHAEDNVVEAIYKMLRIYEEGESKSMMSPEQKSEIDRRATLYRKGKLKSSSWADVKKKARAS